MLPVKHFASSVLSNSNRWGPSLVLDGKIGSSCVSQGCWRSASNSVDNWLQIDFKDVYLVEDITLDFRRDNLGLHIIGQRFNEIEVSIHQLALYT